MTGNRKPCVIHHYKFNKIYPEYEFLINDQKTCINSYLSFTPNCLVWRLSWRKRLPDSLSTQNLDEQYYILPSRLQVYQSVHILKTQWFFTYNIKMWQQMHQTAPVTCFVLKCTFLWFTSNFTTVTRYTVKCHPVTAWSYYFHFMVLFQVIRWLE